ncbi:MAG: YkgJ family cysteine cluster protein [Bacteroidales bacterium]
MDCRQGCGACCIAISISSFIPGMGNGKESGVRCIHLTDDLKCALFNKPERPKVCSDFEAEPDFCGSNREEAFRILYGLEGKSYPGS